MWLAGKKWPLFNPTEKNIKSDWGCCVFCRSWPCVRNDFLMIHSDWLPPKFGLSRMSYPSRIRAMVCVTFSNRLAAISLCPWLLRWVRVRHAERESEWRWFTFDDEDYYINTRNDVTMVCSLAKEGARIKRCGDDGALMNLKLWQALTYTAQRPPRVWQWKLVTCKQCDGSKTCFNLRLRGTSSSSAPLKGLLLIAFASGQDFGQPPPPPALLLLI